MSSQLRRTLKGGIGFFLANVLSRGGGFLFIVVAGILLDVRSFGLLSLALSISSLGRKVFTFGLPNTVQRFLSGMQDARSRRIYGSVILLSGTLGGIGVFLFYVSTPFISTEIFGNADLISALRILSLTVGLDVLFSVGKALLQVRERVAAYTSIDLLFGAGRVGLLAGFVFLLGATETMAAFAFVAAYVFAIVGLLWHIRGLDLRPQFDELTPSARRVLSYSAPLIVVGLGYFVATQTDRLMLGALAPPESVGLYTAASTLGLTLTMVHQALGRILMPMTSEAYMEGTMSEVQRTYRIGSKWVTAINGVGFLLITAIGDVLLRVFGPEYGQAGVHEALVIIALLYFIGTCVGPTGAFLQMTDGHRHESMNTVIFIILNVLMNYFFILWFGLLGAAIATTGSGLIRNALQVGQMLRIHGFNPVSKEQFVLCALGLSGAAGLWLAQGGAYLSLAIGGGSICLIVGLVLGWMTKEEQDLLRVVGNRLVRS